MKPLHRSNRSLYQATGDRKYSDAIGSLPPQSLDL
ncbi:Uncharacterised protein [Vibrio cholerae]|nr:Uncharacterised protein [Vibrio cholerae]CSI54878.1 Uncharacterised protein [Vibrio cholerae]